LSSLCNWKGAQSYKKLPEAIVPKVGHGPKMGQYGFDRACFSVVYLSLLCFIAHLYEANGGTDMEVLACFRPGFYIHILRPHKLIVVLKSVLWLFQRKVLLRFYTRCVFFTEYKYFKPILFNCDSIFTGTLRSTDNFYGKIRVLRSRKQVPVLMKLFRIITYAFDFGFQ